MAYSDYASKLSGNKVNLNDYASNIETVNISSSWNSNAATKQTTNLSNVLSSYKQQCTNLENLISALNLIDDYDTSKRNENSYQSSINNLNPESDSYYSDVEKYTTLLSNARTKKGELKREIDGYLGNITQSYSESLTDIAATSVANTVNVYQNITTLSTKIVESFDMRKTVVIMGSLSENNMYPNFANSGAWGNNNPYSASGLYGQCTWFAWGRFYEIYGFSPGFTGNGNQCVGQLLNAHSDKFYKSSTPVPGAVFSQGLNERYGHVGIVVAVDEANNTITIQDGNYNGKTDSFAVAQKDWGTRTMPLDQFCSKRGGAVFACPRGEV